MPPALKLDIPRIKQDLNSQLELLAIADQTQTRRGAIDFGNASEDKENISPKSRPCDLIIDIPTVPSLRHCQNPTNKASRAHGPTSHPHSSKHRPIERSPHMSALNTDDTLENESFDEWKDTRNSRRAETKPSVRTHKVLGKYTRVAKFPRISKPRSRLIFRSNSDTDVPLLGAAVEKWNRKNDTAKHAKALGGLELE